MGKSNKSGNNNPKTTTFTTEQWLSNPHEIPSSYTSIQKEDWMEADSKLRLARAKSIKVSNERRAANVMRALRGNVIIAVAKLGAWSSSGSSAMLSEFVHSVVDCANQALILVGLHDSDHKADRRHPYGYGKSIYFWSLISALGTFWMGAGVSMRHSIEQLWHPSMTEVVNWQVWSVLAVSLCVDGYVLTKTLVDVKEDDQLNGNDKTKENDSLWTKIWKIRDPALLAILLEDGAACLGVVIAAGGIVLTAACGMPVFDGLAGVGISVLLGGMGLVLVKLNKEFLLGSSEDRTTIAGIERILLQQESIEDVHSMQSQVIGHGTFSVKAEVDFDGTYLAAKLLPRYQKEFLVVGDKLEDEIRVLLSWYAEDIMRLVEREVLRIEAEIRKHYPGAQFIELEPYSKDLYRYAIDDATEGKLKRIEVEALNRYLKSLYMEAYAKKKNKAVTTAKNKTNENDNKEEHKSTTKEQNFTDQDELIWFDSHDGKKQ
eukprot:CAMPEP_0195520076 /NCGR_PEP_ID=MMETSP0794_2-20130614/16060_1 /TAXON_ID=515487 /ORGANISM="Stephanopyxis turris, Strain CCMP 815" /LENGTH=487 /DNA_ID=CAMNT_0040649351 /DNA_START=242 /DNA_END=1708 /DNA_ORIENTATION=+